MVLSVKIIEPPVKDSSKYLAFIMTFLRSNKLILSITRVCNERERKKVREFPFVVTTTNVSVLTYKKNPCHFTCITKPVLDIWL